MKVLYVAPFNQTGYGQAATRYVHSLHSAGVDVVCRNLHMGQTVSTTPLVQSLLRGPLEGVTHVVQHTLPTHYQRCPKIKHVGLFAMETGHLPESWRHRLKLMDAVACVSTEQVDAVAPYFPSNFLVDAIPHACDVFAYRYRYPLMNMLVPYRERDYCIFYGIGEWVRRKNWAGLLRSYYAAFSRADRVLLVIKTGVPGMSSEDAFKKVDQFCKEVFVGMKLGPLQARPDVLVCTERFSEHEMLRLHESCDCYVSASYGEAWGLPAMDAMGMGKPVIVPYSGGYRDYVTDRCGFTICTHNDPCFGAVDSVPELYPGNTFWDAVDIPDFVLSMQTVYRDRELREQMGRAGSARVYDFSFSKVGARFKKFLEDV